MRNRASAKLADQYMLVRAWRRRHLQAPNVATEPAETVEKGTALLWRPHRIVESSRRIACTVCGKYSLLKNMARWKYEPCKGPLPEGKNKRLVDEAIEAG